MQDLAPGFTAEFGVVDKDSWHEIIKIFDDLNIYQTWSYEAPRRNRCKIEHMVFRNEGEVVSAAQVRVMELPLLRLGAAYVLWGPLWKPQGKPADPEVLRLAIRALRCEYAERRGLVVRVFPMLFEEEESAFRTLLNKERYRSRKRKKESRTLILDIRPDLQCLRKNFHQKWRNCLNQAEKKTLEVIEGTEDELFVSFIGLYRDMLMRKRFQEPNDINEYRAIQADLPECWKMRVFLCRDSGGFGAGAICSALGNTGIYLFGATNKLGLTNRGAYLLQWRIIDWLKTKGCVSYDLNGIDPIRNPGTYRFKAGVAGAAGIHVSLLGRYDSYRTFRGYVLSRWGDPLSQQLRQLINYKKKLTTRQD